MSLPDGFSLVEFAEHINRSDAFTTGDAIEAELHVNAAVEVVESMCGPLAPREVVVTDAAAVRGTWVASVWPVLSAAAVNAYDSSEVADVTVDAAGRVRFGTYTGAGTFDVTLQVGRDPIPASIVLATYIIASHLWETQRGRSARPGLFGQGEDVTITPMGFAVPARAAQLLAPHRAPSVA